MSDAVRDPLPGVMYMPHERLARYLSDGVLTRESLPDALSASFHAHAGRTALITLDRTLSYAELDQSTTILAAALLARGLAPTDRVIFQCGNSIELVQLFVACLKAGIIPLCTLPAHRAREIGYLGQFSQARAHIVQPHSTGFDLLEFAIAMRPELPQVQHIIATEAIPDAAKRNGITTLDDLLATQIHESARARLDAIRHDPFQVAVFQLSGGTTGVPKIIPRMSNDYLLNARLSARAFRYTADDVVFCPMPMIHNAAMIMFWLPALLSGAAFAIAGDLSPDTWARLFEKARPTFAGLIRALMPRYDEAIALHPDSVKYLRAFWIPDAARIARIKYGVTTHCLFGMTEGLNMFTLADDPVEVVDTCVGRPIIAQDEVRIVRPGTSQECDIDEEGELQCRGPYTLTGYYNAPEHNAIAFTADGFYRTGDLAIRREIHGETYYAFSGRTKDVVDRGSEKISCEEVELAVATHPSIAEVAIVGMPDTRLGERICAYIVLKQAQPAPGVAALGGFLENYGLAKFKWPEHIEVIDKLPRTSVGKFDKAKLRRDIAEKLTAWNPG
jgi:non-ribosomal peptide synthetase component E (peptide arylation enzyme)